MSTSNLTTREMFDSLTGFDEIAIETHMGFDIYSAFDQSGETKPGLMVKAIRAVIFVALTRDGRTAPDAKNAVLSMTSAQINDFFAPESEESVADVLNESPSAVGNGSGAPQNLPPSV